MRHPCRCRRLFIMMLLSHSNVGLTLFGDDLRFRIWVIPNIKQGSCFMCSFGFVAVKPSSTLYESALINFLLICNFPKWWIRFSERYNLNN